jgi:YqaJ-like viral recombinase domain
LRKKNKYKKETFNKIKMNFKTKLMDLITLFEKWLSDPEDHTQIEQWSESAHSIAYSYDFNDNEQYYIDRIITMYSENFKMKIDRHIIEMTSDLPSKEQLDELLNRKQIEQRTPEWYKQMTEILSASELGNLFAAPRQRAKLVVSKTVPYQPRYQPLAVLSDRMNAFDWGIRFEPVVKQIYEYKYEVTLKELGRLHHPIDPRCTASPDGLIYSCPKNIRTGRLIEIKCPVTREIDGIIPKDYYAQMQMQLQVTGLTKCDYVEACFSSPYQNQKMKEGPGIYNGRIAVVRYNEIKDNQEFYYVYGPVNCSVDWNPVIPEDDEIVEWIPWSLITWSEQLVLRNEDWWNTLQPTIERFWEDVEKAKKGDFTVPESTRASKKPKIEKCLIQFNKVDENGNELE